MGIVTPFKRRLYPGVRMSARRSRMNALLPLAVACGIAIAGYFVFSSSTPSRVVPAVHAKQFAACGYLIRDNCVIDGDTFYYHGDKVRIADIDAPETRGAQCDAEAALGARATTRLRELLNEGPFELRSFQSRDTDRYGRKLRIVMRNGASLGERLVTEGLARRWSGRRMPWCGV